MYMVQTIDQIPVQHQDENKPDKRELDVELITPNFAKLPVLLRGIRPKFLTWQAWRELPTSSWYESVYIGLQIFWDLPPMKIKLIKTWNGCLWK